MCSPWWQIGSVGTVRPGALGGKEQQWSGLPARASWEGFQECLGIRGGPGGMLVQEIREE